MSWYLFIDDERNPMDVFWMDGPAAALYFYEDWYIARNILEVRELLANFGMPIFISFDHDLGANEPTGYDIAKELVEFDLEPRYNLKFPEDFAYVVHSKNPVGKQNIVSYLDNYFKQRNM